MHESPAPSALAPDLQAVRDDDLPGRLRASIADEHRAIEELPMSRALVAGDVRLEPYLALLSDLAPIHAAIEERLDGDAVLRRLFDGPLVRRQHALAADLRHWGAAAGALGEPSRRLAAWVADCSRAEALGACYVIAGSCLGAAVLAPRLARAFRVPCAPGAGLDYQFIPPQVLGSAWRQVKERLAAHGTDGDTDAACNGACALMRGLRLVYAGRSP